MNAVPIVLAAVIPLLVLAYVLFRAIGKNGVRHDYLAPLAFLVCLPPFDAACRLPSFSICS
jgi:hypothetical protein